MTCNEWCRVLGIERPSLAAAARHREANSYALLLVALLERGQPMTLLDVAARFEEVGIASRLPTRRARPTNTTIALAGAHPSSRSSPESHGSAPSPASV